MLSSIQLELLATIIRKSSHLQYFTLWGSSYRYGNTIASNRFEHVLAALATCTELVQLRLQPTDYILLEEFSPLLKKLNLADGRPFISGLFSCSSLTHLQFNDFHMNDTGSDMIKLSTCTKLVHIAFWNCKLSRPEVQALSTVLLSLPLLSNIAVRCNHGLKPGNQNPIKDIHVDS